MRILFLSLFLVLSLAASCFAQNNETMTITTYYPAPYGVYRNLRLNPSDVPPTAATGLAPGVMYYNNSLGVIRYYNNTGAWVNLSEGGGSGTGPWTVSGNNIYNANAGNVGIGTTTPTAKFSVQGDIRASGMLVVGTGSTAVDGAIRFNGTGFEGYYNGQWNSLMGNNTTPIGPGTLAGSGTFYLTCVGGVPCYLTCGSITAPALCTATSTIVGSYYDYMKCAAGWQRYNAACITVGPGQTSCSWICQKLP